MLREVLIFSIIIYFFSQYTFLPDLKLYYSDITQAVPRLPYFQGGGLTREEPRFFFSFRTSTDSFPDNVSIYLVYQVSRRREGGKPVVPLALFRNTLNFEVFKLIFPNSKGKALKWQFWKGRPTFWRASLWKTTFYSVGSGLTPCLYIVDMKVFFILMDILSGVYSRA